LEIIKVEEDDEELCKLPEKYMNLRYVFGV